MIRGICAGTIVGFLALWIGFDAMVISEPINPYDALPPLALGSGQGSAGAICSAGKH